MHVHVCMYVCMYVCYESFTLDIQGFRKISGAIEAITRPTYLHGIVKKVIDMSISNVFQSSSDCSTSLSLPRTCAILSPNRANWRNRVHDKKSSQPRQSIAQEQQMIQGEGHQ
jgi:hypothetical protein